MSKSSFCLIQVFLALQWKHLYNYKISQFLLTITLKRHLEKAYKIVEVETMTLYILIKVNVIRSISFKCLSTGAVECLSLTLLPVYCTMHLQR